MKFIAPCTETRNVEVDISTSKIITNLWRRGMEKLGKPESAQYINDKGVWERWDKHPHGSGISTTFSKATKEQLDLNIAIQLIRETLKEES
tara:strand:+ start:416 stop:688 length:273 start_codon:yes stop_codon:yes gene_type:complete